MINDFDLELLSLLELREIRREKRFNETSNENYRPSEITYKNQDLISCADHFCISLSDSLE